MNAKNPRPLADTELRDALRVSDAERKRLRDALTAVREEGERALACQTLATDLVSLRRIIALCALFHCVFLLACGSPFDAARPPESTPDASHAIAPDAHGMSDDANVDAHDRPDSAGDRHDGGIASPDASLDSGVDSSGDPPADAGPCDGGPVGSCAGTSFCAEQAYCVFDVLYGGYTVAPLPKSCLGSPSCVCLALLPECGGPGTGGECGPDPHGGGCAVKRGCADEDGGIFVSCCGGAGC